VVSKSDPSHGGLDGVIFQRFTQLLSQEQQSPRRKIFVVIDEFPTLWDNYPCPDIDEMLLRLASRGVVPLFTDVLQKKGSST
jgi:hypothetical protein